MSVAFKKGAREDGNLISSQMFAKVFQAYMECSDEVQASIRDMVAIVNSDDATEDEIHAAVATISEALFPSNHNGSLGIDLEEFEAEAPESIQTVLRELDEEEAAFADRVSSLMAARDMTQGDLAAKIGVGQSAISMMLARNCRPQIRTVEKIANALGVNPSDIWPPFNRQND